MIKEKTNYQIVPSSLAFERTFSGQSITQKGTWKSKAREYHIEEISANLQREKFFNPKEKEN